MKREEVESIIKNFENSEGDCGIDLYKVHIPGTDITVYNWGDDFEHSSTISYFKEVISSIPVSSPGNPIEIHNYKLFFVLQDSLYTMENQIIVSYPDIIKIIHYDDLNKDLLMDILDETIFNC